MANSTKNTEKVVENRGRIQIQGKKPYIEKSSAWTTTSPITYQEGLSRLDNLWNSLSPAEQKERKQAYECAKKYIENAGKLGGLSAPVSKTCQDKVRKDPQARIDIEIKTGKAFVK